MYCSTCGKEINDDVVFCPYCGATVTANQATANSTVANPTVANNGTAVKEQKKKTIFSNKMIAFLIGIAVIIFIILIFVGVRSAMGVTCGKSDEELMSMAQDGGVSPYDFKQFATEMFGATYYREDIYDGLNAEFNQFISTESSASSDFDGVYGICLLTYSEDVETEQEEADADILDNVVKSFYNYRGYGGINARLGSAVCDETSCLQYFEFDDTAFGSISCSFLITGNSVIGVLMDDERDSYSWLYSICGGDYLNLNKTYVERLFESTKIDISSYISEYYGMALQ